MKNIYILRHGETELNRLGIVQGSGVDAVLNSKGLAQARAFYEHYSPLVRFEVVLISALQRTRQTIQGFIEAGVPVESFADINEINWGIHEGQEPAPWIIDNYNRLIARWQAGELDARIEGGESAAELAARLQRFVAHLKTRSEEHILICTHGRTLRCLLTILDNQPVGHMEHYLHHNTGLYRVSLEEERFRIEVHNDISHLQGLEALKGI